MDQPTTFLPVAVDDGGQVDESLPGVDVGDVADELHAGTIGGEVPLHEIGHGRCGLGVSFGRDPERARLTGHEALVAHDLPHQLRGAFRVLLGEVDVDAPVSVGAVRRREEVADSLRERFPTVGGGRLGPG